MDKSNTITVHDIEQAVNMTVDYLETWKKNQLFSILYGPLGVKKIPPIISIDKKNFVIGRHFLQNQKDGLWKLEHHEKDFTYYFSSRLSAVCYSVSYQLGKINQATQILWQDREVLRLSIKADQFYQRYCQAKRKKDTPKIDLFSTRFQETNHKLKLSRSLLEKSLNSAKYIKF